MEDVLIGPNKIFNDEFMRHIPTVLHELDELGLDYKHRVIKGTFKNNAGYSYGSGFPVLNIKFKTQEDLNLWKIATGAKQPWLMIYAEVASE